MAYTKTLFGFLLALLVGCATVSTPLSGTTELTGKPRSAISADEVKVYDQYPYAYEVIAIVRSKAGEKSAQQGVEPRVLEELKTEAAKVGANGLVLKALGQSEGSEESYQMVTADAIYVLKEKK